MGGEYYLVSQLFDINSKDEPARSPKKQIHINWGTGIAGYVAKNGQPVVVADAYQVSEQYKIICMWYHK